VGWAPSEDLAGQGELVLLAGDTTQLECRVENTREPVGKLSWEIANLELDTNVIHSMANHMGEFSNVTQTREIRNVTGAQDGGVVHCVYQQGDLYSGRVKATLQVFTLIVRISKKVCSSCAGEVELQFSRASRGPVSSQSAQLVRQKIEKLTGRLPIGTDGTEGESPVYTVPYKLSLLLDNPALLALRPNFLVPMDNQEDLRRFCHCEPQLQVGTAEEEGSFLETGKIGSFVETGKDGSFVETGKEGSFVETGKEGSFAETGKKESFVETGKNMFKETGGNIFTETGGNTFIETGGDSTITETRDENTFIETGGETIFIETGGNTFTETGGENTFTETGGENTFTETGGENIYQETVEEEGSGSSELQDGSPQPSLMGNFVEKKKWIRCVEWQHTYWRYQQADRVTWAKQGNSSSDCLEWRETSQCGSVSEFEWSCKCIKAVGGRCFLKQDKYKCKNWDAVGESAASMLERPRPNLRVDRDPRHIPTLYRQRRDITKDPCKV